MTLEIIVHDVRLDISMCGRSGGNHGKIHYFVLHLSSSLVTFGMVLELFSVMFLQVLTQISMTKLSLVLSKNLVTQQQSVKLSNSGCLT